LVKEKKPRVAIFGGSFDPPHKGHQAVVAQALKKLDIDLLIVLPAYLNPFKSHSVALPQERLSWCETLFGSLPNVIVSDYEIAQGRSVKSAQSIRHFQQMYDVAYLIIGADNLATITKWHDFDFLNQEIVWAIAQRPGYQTDTSMLRAWVILPVDEAVSSTQIRQGKALDQLDKTIAASVKKTLKETYPMTLDERIETIVQILDEKKAEEIEVFNLDGADYIADRVVIANSLNLKHTQALYDQLKEVLKPKGESFLHADMSDEWIVADLGDILIHIMIPEYRQRYSLEQFLSELVENQKNNA